MSIEMKIKFNELSEEARINKREVGKLKRALKRINKAKQRALEVHSNWHGTDYTVPVSGKINSLTNHRRHVVRVEARATHLARMFMKRRSYERVEGERKVEKDKEFRTVVLPKVLRMVNKYGNEPHAIELYDLQKWVGLESVNYNPWDFS